MGNNQVSSRHFDNDGQVWPGAALRVLLPVLRPSGTVVYVYGRALNGHHSIHIFGNEQAQISKAGFHCDDGITLKLSAKVESKVACPSGERQGRKIRVRQSGQFDIGGTGLVAQH